MKDSFYNPLTPEQSKKAFANEFDFDAPSVSEGVREEGIRLKSRRCIHCSRFR